MIWHIFLFASFNLVGPSHRIDADLGGTKSVHTDDIVKTYKSWPLNKASRAPASFATPVVVEPLRVEGEGREWYIGMHRQMRVEASIEKVLEILSDFEHYSDLYKGIKEVKVVSHSGNKTVTAWERRVPVFFIPNVHFELIFVIDQSNPGRVFIRNQLKEPDTLKGSDSLVVLEKESATQTLYTAYDYYEANWGPAKILGNKKIWRDSIEGGFLDAMAIKLKAEHSDWDYDKIHDAADDEKDRIGDDRLYGSLN